MPRKFFAKRVEIMLRLITTPSGWRTLLNAAAQRAAGSAAWKRLPAAFQLALASPRSVTASQSRATFCAAVAFGSCAKASLPTSSASHSIANASRSRARTTRLISRDHSRVQELIDRDPGDAPLSPDFLTLKIAGLETGEHIRFADAEHLRDLRGRE